MKSYITVIFIAVIVGVGCTLLMQRCNRPVQDNSLQLSIDSMRANDRYRDSVVQVLRIQYTQDSIRIAGLQQYIATIPGTITNIKRDYDKKRQHITTLSTDEHLELFSRNLSQEDSTRN